MSNYASRLEKLEAQIIPAAVPLRVIHTIIDPVDGVVGAFVDGQNFNRLNGESEDALIERALRSTDRNGA
jgi:hypothetical protein